MPTSPSPPPGLSARRAGGQPRLASSLKQPHWVGVVNITPDSFSDGGRYFSPQPAIHYARTLQGEGAEWIELGAESTRPGSLPVDAPTQWERLGPVLQELCGTLTSGISVDTGLGPIARRALDHGAGMINTVWGRQRDPNLYHAVSRFPDAYLCITHMRGTPRDMQDHPFYDDVVAEVRAALHQEAESAIQAGVREDRIIVDPGLGFGKRPQDNLVLLNRLGELRTLGHPVMVGPSRKSFIGQATGRPDPHERQIGTLACVAWSVLRGADFVRVHDVGDAREFFMMMSALVMERLP